MEGIIEMGVWGILGVGVISVIAMLVLHYLAQRSQQHQAEIAQQNLSNIHSMGIQAIIGANEMVIIDESLESRKSPNAAVVIQKKAASDTSVEVK